MWDSLRSGALWLSRPARVVYHRRQREVRDYEALPVLAVDIDPKIDLDQNHWINAALAFSSKTVDIAIVPPLPQSGVALADHLERHFEHRPKGYLYLGKKPSREEVAALKLLNIPSRVVTDLTPPSDADEFPNEQPMRMKWHEAFDRRQIIYLHISRSDNMINILQAMRMARRNFPNLILVISGIEARDVPARDFGFSIGTQREDLSNIQYLDILVLKSPEFDPVISSVATLQLVTQTRNMRAIAKEALMRSAALVLYDVRTQGLGELAELTNSGTVWLVKKKDSLGTTLSQVLGLEEAANISTQSLARLTETNNALLDALEQLVGVERAA